MNEAQIDFLLGRAFGLDDQVTEDKKDQAIRDAQNELGLTMRAWNDEVARQQRLAVLELAVNNFEALK